MANYSRKTITNKLGKKQVVRVRVDEEQKQSKAKSEKQDFVVTTISNTTSASGSTRRNIIVSANIKKEAI